MNNLKKTYFVNNRAILACVVIVSILTAFYWLNDSFEISKSALESTKTQSNSSQPEADVSLMSVSSETLNSPMSLLATSVQDNNAVVKIGGSTKVISVGDVLDSTDSFLSGQTKIRVVQIAPKQVVFKESKNNNVYLVRMSKGGKPSVIEKITSDIQIDMPHSRG